MSDQVAFLYNCRFSRFYAVTQLFFDRNQTKDMAVLLSRPRGSEGPAR